MIQATLLAVDSRDFIYAYFPDSGLFISKNNGNDWQSMTSGLKEISAMTVLSDDKIILGGSDQYIYVSKDLGSTWESTKYTEIASITSTIYETYDNKIIIGSTTGTYLTDSTFNAWDSANVGLNNSIAVDIIENDTKQLLNATNNQGLFLFNETQQEWEKNNWGLTSNFLTVLEKDSHGVLYIGTYDNGVFRSTDGGTNWNIIKNGLPSHIISLAINKDDHVFAGTDNGVFRLPEGSYTWKSLNNELDFKVIRDLIVNSNGYIFIATDGGIYSSSSSTHLGEQR